MRWARSAVKMKLSSAKLNLKMPQRRWNVRENKFSKCKIMRSRRKRNWRRPSSIFVISLIYRWSKQQACKLSSRQRWKQCNVNTIRLLAWCKLRNKPWMLQCQKKSQRYLMSYTRRNLTKVLWMPRLMSKKTISMVKRLK